MIAELNAMQSDIEQLKTMFGKAMQVGPVEEIDAAKGYRLKLGEGDDGPYLSPWYPHPETGKTSVPLKMGQIVGVVNPTGDPRQGFLLRGGYSDGHPTPNQDMAANVFQDAGVRVEVVGGKVIITAATAVTVNASVVNLGGEGGKKVARVGDKVEVGSGSSAGLWPIVEGSSVVSAVD